MRRKSFGTRALLTLRPPSGQAQWWHALPDQVEAARKVQAKLDEVLNSDDHKWYLGKLDPEEAARRKRAAEEFKARHKD